MPGSNTALITGAGGFIGHHLARFLKAHGQYERIVGVDLVTPESRGYANHSDRFITGDLRDPLFVDALYQQVKPRHVYHLAADMGGLGYLTGREFEAMYNNGRIDLNVIGQAPEHGAERLLYTSSAVVYPVGMQTEAEVTALKESDAFPADPAEEGYGWQKIMGERLCQYAAERFPGFETRVVRLHNCYGPEGSWNDGREKAPAALMRKVAEAALDPPRYAHTYRSAVVIPDYSVEQVPPEIDIWGDGQQTRSFMYIDDALRGIYAVMVSSYPHPLNVGSAELTTINNMVDIIARVAGVQVAKRYDLAKPQGVRGRNSDNTLVASMTGWRPLVSLEEGIRLTYPWIAQRVREAHSS